MHIEISQLGKMPRRMRQAVISCLYKKGLREDIINWIRVSLLSYDLMYTKILANKIQPTSKDIIGPEQTAAIKGRTNAENLQLNRDVKSYANANKFQVDWNFLFKAL